MSFHDDTYLNLLRDVLAKGVTKGDRTGTGTISSFGHQMRFDLSKGFPLLTTKKMGLKNVAAELLWFLSGNTKVSDLQAMGCHIWDEWQLPDGTIGEGSYGAMWRRYPKVSIDSGGYVNEKVIDQISELVEALKANPDSRRHLVWAYNPATVDEAALPPCHCGFQCYVANGRLSLQVYQRSADLFLGVPYNIASYALLTHMLAQQCSLEVGDLIWTGGDCHIYSNHMEQVTEQLSRMPSPSPELVILRKTVSIFDYKVEDFTVDNYHPKPAIRAPVAV